jgi:Holliday junction resolvase RusA-like endonuclease
MIEVVFPGRPVPWARHRMGKGRSYMPAKQKKQMEDLALYIRLVAKEQQPAGFAGPVILQVKFDYGKNQTWFRVSESEDPGLRAKRGDIDNLVKWVMESLQASGVVKDDAQVAFLIAEKVE